MSISTAPVTVHLAIDVLNNVDYANPDLPNSIRSFSDALMARGIRTIYVTTAKGEQSGLMQPEQPSSSVGAAVRDKSLLNRLQFGEQGPRGDEYIFNKDTYSALKESELTDFLKQQGVENVILSGRETFLCIDSTLQDALKNGFKPHVVTDLLDDNVIATREQALDPQWHEQTLSELRAAEREKISFTSSSELLDRFPKDVSNTLGPPAALQVAATIGRQNNLARTRKMIPSLT